MFSEILKSCKFNPARITKADKDLPKSLILKSLNFQTKLETFPKFKKNNSIYISYENKEKYLIYVLKNSYEEKYVDYY